MREEKVTYSEVRIQSPPCQQRRAASEKPETKGGSTSLSSWKLTALVLWVICLLLLGAVGILILKLTVTFNQETEQRGVEHSGLSTNASVQSCHPCEDHWHQRGTNCYSLSRVLVPWRDCQHQCSMSRSNFLKINTEKEMGFVEKLSKIQCHLRKEKFWISLYYNVSYMEWAWLDGSILTVDKLQSKQSGHLDNSCKYIRNGQFYDGDCEEHGYCICKKTSGEDQIIES